MLFRSLQRREINLTQRWLVVLYLVKVIYKRKRASYPYAVDCFPYAGNVNDSALNNVGSNGRYWSRTANSTNNAYNLNFNSTNVNPANNNSRYNGYSVRCVAVFQSYNPSKNLVVLIRAARFFQSLVDPKNRPKI